MAATRLFATGSRSAAEALFRALDAAFEEEGHPVAIRAIDEDADIHEVSVYAQDDAQAAEATIRRFWDGSLERETLPEIDWVAKSLEGLRPVRAGRFLVHGAHDRAMRRAGDIAIEIEAGQAFGTGHHGTTAGCLEMIGRVMAREKPQNALDLGTGSAVLAIAIARLGRIPVLATDIDPVATRVAAGNVRLNGVTALVRTETAAGFDHPAFRERAPFDLIVANILAKPLIALAPSMARQAAAGGSLILSGILDRQREAVLAAYVGQHFRHVSTLSREGWSTLHLKR